MQLDNRSVADEATGGTSPSQGCTRGSYNERLALPNVPTVRRFDLLPCWAYLKQSSSGLWLCLMCGTTYSCEGLLNISAQLHAQGYHLRSLDAIDEHGGPSAHLEREA